jgi:hypothetical protein
MDLQTVDFTSLQTLVILLVTKPITHIGPAAVINTILRVLEDDVYYPLALVWACTVAFTLGLALGGLWALTI